MDQFVNFITNHWVLSAAFIVALVALVLMELFQKRLGIPEISPEAMVQWINHQNAVAIDIRADVVFTQGHIIGAEHISLSQWEAKTARWIQWIEKPVVIVCETGNTAQKIGLELRKKGFKQVMILKGGIQGWKMAGLPLVKS